MSWGGSSAQSPQGNPSSVCPAPCPGRGGPNGGRTGAEAPGGAAWELRVPRWTSGSQSPDRQPLASRAWGQPLPEPGHHGGWGAPVLGPQLSKKEKSEVAPAFPAGLSRDEEKDRVRPGGGRAGGGGLAQRQLRPGELRGSGSAESRRGGPGWCGGRGAVAVRPPGLCSQRWARGPPGRGPGGVEGRPGPEGSRERNPGGRLASGGSGGQIWRPGAFAGEGPEPLGGGRCRL